MSLPQRSILGIPVHDVTMDKALARARQMLKEARPHAVYTLNPEIVLKASRDREYATVLAHADLALPDGIGLVWASKIDGPALHERVAGVDFMLRLCALAAREGKSVFLLGGRSGVAQRTAQALQRKFPSLHIAGFLENIEQWRGNSALQHTDIVFVALGAPKQERWIHRALAELPQARILMGVGGAFDMIAGITPRAPLGLQKIGLEWLWRLALEPHRFARICNAVIVFPAKVLAHAIFR